MATLDGVPHLVIRCDPSLAEAVRDLATGRMTTSGFSGRLVVLGDPDIAVGDAASNGPMAAWSATSAS